MPRKSVEKEEPFVGRSEELLSAEDARNLLGNLMRSSASIPVGMNHFAGYFRNDTIFNETNVPKERLAKWYTQWLSEDKERVRLMKLAAKKVEDALFAEAKDLTVANLRPEHIAVLKKRKVI